MIPFLAIAIVFAYTTIQNIHERPEGIKIASFFIVAIVAASLFSRVWRSTELRVERIELDDLARELVRKAAVGTVRIVANRRDTGDALEYKIKETEKRTDNHIPEDEPILFFEVTPGTLRNSQACCKSAGNKLTGIRSCVPYPLRYQTLSQRSCSSCATKPESSLTHILAGAKVIRCPIY